MIQNTVDPAIIDVVAQGRSGDGNPAVPDADAPKCDGDSVIPSADAPTTSRVRAPRAPGEVVTTMFSSAETRNRSRSVSAKLPHLSSGFSRSGGFAQSALTVRLSNGVGMSSS